MKKFFNKAVLNGTTVMGDGLTYPRIPNVYTGDNEGGYQRGDMMDANAVVEMIKELTDTGKITIEELKNLINEEIQERVEGDQDQQRYTDQKIKDLIGTSPETLDTLKEIADALGEDPDFAANVWNKIAELTTKHNEDVQELQDAITSGFENIDFTPYVKKTDVVTDTTNGLMLASDKSKLDAFEEAEQYEKAIRLPRYVVGRDISEFAITTDCSINDVYIEFDTVDLINNTTKRIKTSITKAGKYGAGVMSGYDKEKLDSLVNYKAGNGINITGDTISCTLDTSLYSIVTELPETGLPNKIYLLPSTKTEEGNIYTEYGYVDNKWEEIGKYKSDVDLSPYERALNLPSDVIKTLGVQSGANYVNVYSYKEDLDRGILSEVSEFDIPKATSEKAGIITAQDKAKLDAIEAGAQVNTIESVSVNGTPLEITNKGVDIPNATTEKDGMMSKADKTKLNSLENYTLPVATNTTLGGVHVSLGAGINDNQIHVTEGDGSIQTSLNLIYNSTDKRLILKDFLADKVINSVDCTKLIKEGPIASTKENGLMSKEDKAKLDSQPTIKASDATGVTDDDYVVIKKSEYQSILDRLSALENKA